MAATVSPAVMEQTQSKCNRCVERKWVFGLIEIMPDGWLCDVTYCMLLCHVTVVILFANTVYVLV